MTHSFPTRRSSDLHGAAGVRPARYWRRQFGAARLGQIDERRHGSALAVVGAIRVALVLRTVLAKGRQWGGRSEEHTSELQSLMRISYAVFFLKKKHE